MGTDDQNRRTPPKGSPIPGERKKTPVRQFPIVDKPAIQTRPGTENERDRLQHKHGYDRPSPIPRSYESWDEQHTPPNIGDPETYRKVRELQQQTAKQDVQIAVIVTDLGHVKDQVEKIVPELQRMSNSIVRVATLVEEDRKSVTTTETTALIKQTASTATKETLADRVLEMDREARRLRYRLWGKLGAAALGGGSVIALIIAALSKGC